MLRRQSRGFVVTPKSGDTSRQLRPAAPTLAVISVLTSVALLGLVRDQDAATLNNVAFAGLHVAVLFHGVLGAVLPGLATAAVVTDGEELDQVAA